MMKTVNTSELTGAALDWAVAKCEGYDKKGALKADKRRILIPHPDGGGQLFRASTDWAQGGPIIERESISIAKLEETLTDAMAPHPSCWSGHIDGVYVRYGPTPLIAAMRCYVASKLGDTIEVPDELL